MHLYAYVWTFLRQKQKAHTALFLYNKIKCITCKLKKIQNEFQKGKNGINGTITVVHMTLDKFAVSNQKIVINWKAVQCTI